MYYIKLLPSSLTTRNLKMLKQVKHRPGLFYNLQSRDVNDSVTQRKMYDLYVTLQ